MFTIWEAIPELSVLVLSTDPAENPQGITLQDWHDAANAFDDDDDTGESGVTLTTYAFMKGVEAGEELDITSPGTVMFVNAEGEIMATKVGILKPQVCTLTPHHGGWRPFSRSDNAVRPGRA